MARTFTASPRQIEWMIVCHPGEVTHNLCQQAMLAKFTDEELEKIEKAVSVERQDREWRALNESQDRRFAAAATSKGDKDADTTT